MKNMKEPYSSEMFCTRESYLIRRYHIKGNNPFETGIDYDKVWDTVLSDYSYLKQEYKNAKLFLKPKQKLLFKKYMLAVKKYEMIANKFTIGNNNLIDDLIVKNNAGRISRDIRYSFDDEFIGDIDKNKFNKAKEEVEKEVKRIRNVIEKMLLSDGEYVSDYTDDEIREYFSDEENVEKMVKLSNEIKNSKESKVLNLKNQ